MVHAQSPSMPSLWGPGQRGHEFENRQDKARKEKQEDSRLKKYVSIALGVFLVVRQRMYALIIAVVSKRNYNNVW